MTGEKMIEIFDGARMVKRFEDTGCIAIWYGMQTIFIYGANRGTLLNKIKDTNIMCAESAERIATEWIRKV